MTLFTKNTREKVVGYAVISAIIIGYWTYWTLHPSYWFNGDPAAFYLVDSLAIFIGKSYTYVDHPGTPIHIIGTLLLAVTRPFFQDASSFIQFFVNKPVAFFLMVHTFLMATHLFTSIFFFNVTYSSLKHFRFIGATALALAYFVLHPQSFQALTLWSHNSLNYSFGTLFLVWLYRELNKEASLDRRFLFLSGFAAGILTTAHIYFFTWIACGITVIFLYSTRIDQSYKSGVSKSLIFSLAGLAGIISMLIPVYKELPRFATWLFEITTHTGMYGSGEAGIFSTEVTLIAIRFWWTNTTLMMTLLATTVITITWLAFSARRKKIAIPTPTQAMTIGLLIQITLLLILFTKAAVKARYTLALAGTLPILILLMINMFEKVNFSKARWTVTVHVVILIAMMIVFPRVLQFTLERSYYEEEVLSAKTEVVNRLAKELGIQEYDVKIVNAYGVPVKCGNMLIASGYTGHLKEEIGQMCPNEYGIYDTHIQLNPAQPLPDIREIDWDLVIWPGNGSDLPDYLDSVGAVNVPSSWRIHRSRWYFIHADVVE